MPRADAERTIWRIEFGWGDTFALLDFAHDDEDARWLVGVAAAIINTTGIAPNAVMQGVAAVPVARKDGEPRAWRVVGGERVAWLRARCVPDPGGS